MKKSLQYLRNKLGMNNPTVDNVEAPETDVLIPWRTYNYQYNFENGDGMPCKSKKFRRKWFEHDKDYDGEDAEENLDDEEEKDMEDMEESVSDEVLNLDIDYDDDDWNDEWSLLVDPDEEIELIDAGDEYEDDGNLTETIKKKWVIRDGKKKLKLVSDREDYKVIRTDTGAAREVKMTSSEKLERERQQKRGALKRKREMSQIQAKRKKSIMRRTWDKTGNGPKNV